MNLNYKFNGPHLMKYTRSSNKKVKSTPLPDMARRLWETLCEPIAELTWGDLNKSQRQLLEQTLTDTCVNISGKDTFKEEFVTAGGITLKEIDFRTMQSRMCTGLYFAGEVIDIDAITGGFNFQACWTEGYLIGAHINANNL
jgi:predicted flavoprotein YhiN